MLMAALHEGGRGGVVPAEGNDPVEVVQGDAQFGFSLASNLNGFPILAEVGSFEGDEEGVEVGFHRAVGSGSGGVCMRTS